MTHSPHTNHLKGLALLAVGLLTLLVFSMPAVGEQGDSPKSITGSGSKDAGVAVQSSSTVTKAAFAPGSGFNFLGVKVSNHGNLMSFESPAGRQAVFGAREGYAVCSQGGGVVNGHDTGDIEEGFGAPTFAQPNGAWTFPLTVTRRTTDGKFQLTQVWNKPDPVEKDVTVAMTLKNVSGAPIDSNVLLSRSGDFDLGDNSADLGAKTIDSAWMWDDEGGPEVQPAGLKLTALTFGTNHAARIETTWDWMVGRTSPTLSASRLGCQDLFTQTPTPAARDLAMRSFYVLEGGLAAGQSKTVKFEYGRM
jgi:hypothetical protein